jgi:septation ring formation regulator EzrA
MDKRKYTLRSKEDQLAAIMKLVTKLEYTEHRRLERIGKLREKAQKLQNQIAPPAPQENVG